jgi:flagellar M-ring protein FliF
MRFFQQLSQQLQQVWRETTVAGRMGFIVLSAICLAAIGGVAYWSSQPDYRVLFSSMSPEDAGAVTGKLEAKGIPFQLSAGGTTISVPAAMAQQARLDLAVAGLPSGGAKGYELLEGSPLGMTPFLQHVNYGRAQQAELAKTIMQLDPVAEARVHIVRPEPTPFVREQKPTTASVVLKLKRGASLSRHDAAGIVSLIVNSVEGLTTDGVTILDTTGRVLSGPKGDKSGAAASAQLETRREIEAYLASKAEEMLSHLLGPGRAIVRVTADINFKRMKETRETIDPESRVVKKEKSTQKKSSTASSARGAAGAASNSGKPTADSGGTGTGTQDEESENEYDFSTTTQQLEQPGGEVERLTVAAMVDLMPSGEEAEGKADASITITDVEEIIKRAVGFKPQRDEIKVTSTKLAGAPVNTFNDPEWLVADRWQHYEKLARHLSLGIAALVALLLGRMVLKRLQPAAPAAVTETMTQEDRNRAIGQLVETAQQSPDDIALLLNTWLDEAEASNREATTSERAAA